MTQPLASASGSSGASQDPPVPAPPAPTFDAIPLSADVRKAIDELGYINPTPVQIAVYDPATRGKSLVVQARTGTGKTAAFGLPIIDSLIKKNQHNVQALILTPTRELALQVSRELDQLGKFRGTKVVAIYGGAPMGKQIDALEDGAQVVVGTPGRVLDHCRRGTLDTSNIRIFVLDEADEMLSMGFAKELNAIIEHLPPGERQGLYFSATIPPDVERLANKHLKDPEYVTLSSDQVGALQLAHYVYLVREGDKRSAILSIIEVEDPQSAVVFCNTKDETERVAELLKSRGYDADWLNGDLEQKERERVMSATREGKLRFLVATDVAARGIDISHLTHVINADFPESAEQYVHRTGRTGRAGRTGTAISVVGPKDVGHLYMLRLTYKIRPIERMLPTKGELKTRAEADIITFLAEAYAGRTADPMHLAVARRLFTHEQAESIVAGLLADHLGANPMSDPLQEAADARRAKNPPPAPPPPREPREDAGAGPRGRGRRDELREAPRTLRDGERPGEGRGRRDGARGDASRVAAAPRDPSTEGVPRDRGMGPRERSDAPRIEGAPRPVGDAAGAPRADGRGPRRSPDTHGREGVPQATLSEWEPPSDEDDDRPILTDAGARRGAPRSGPVPVEDQATAVGLPDEPAAATGRPRDARARGGEDDDDSVDTDRHPRLPRLPGITEEGGGVAAAPAAPREAPARAPRREGRGRPTREREGRPARDADRGPSAAGAPVRVADGETPTRDVATRDADRPAREPRAPRAPREPRDEQPREPDARDDASLSNIFLNVGKRDGVSPQEIQQLLADAAGIPHTETSNIRVRDRITFVTVKKELADRTIKALAGQVVGGRTVIAEPARDKA